MICIIDAVNTVALIYYIHLLGDHMDDSSYKVNNGLKMEVGGRKDKTDIIHELETHISVVLCTIEDYFLTS